MISEVENILKGRVESTIEYDTSKKIIGISQSNLIPGEDGIVPLSKQSAFIVETKEEEVVALETLDLSSDAKEESQEALQSVNEDNSIPGLKEPEFNDIAVDAPLEVNNPQELSDLNMTASSEVVEKPLAVESTENISGSIDIQMPEMPDKIVGLEPTEAKTDLFELPKQENSSYEIPNDNKEEIIDTTEPQLNEPPIEENNVTKTNVDINTLIEEKQKVILEEISKIIKTQFEEIAKIYASSDVKENNIEKVETVETENPLMDDALAQINNMVIPGETSGPKL